MSIGSFKAAVVSGISEATAALVNFNLDFSLFEAPKEFSPVGDALSSIRRGSAESGVVHTTPRKLGTLFDPLLPDTPQLIKAYGSRASEMEIKSKIENRNTNYGVSESQVASMQRAFGLRRLRGRRPSRSIFWLASLLGSGGSSPAYK